MARRKLEPPMQIVDGRWYALAFQTQAHDPAEPFREACCDCGLTHRVEYKVENGRLWVRYTVDRRATTRERARRAQAART